MITNLKIKLLNVKIHFKIFDILLYGFPSFTQILNIWPCCDSIYWSALCTYTFFSQEIGSHCVLPINNQQKRWVHSSQDLGADIALVSESLQMRASGFRFGFLCPFVFLFLVFLSDIFLFLSGFLVWVLSMINS